jgi:hypothetical protein
MNTDVSEELGASIFTVKAKTEAAVSSETFVSIYMPARCRIVDHDPLDFIYK